MTAATALGMYLVKPPFTFDPIRSFSTLALATAYALTVGATVELVAQ